MPDAMVVDGVSMQVEVPTEVQMGGGSTEQKTPAIEGFSGRPEDVEKDMALIKAQMSKPQEIHAPAPIVQDPVQNPVVPEPVQPDGNQPPPAPATQQVTEVPDKFKRADGTVDMEKLTTSYLEAEKALKKAQQAAPRPIQDQAPGSPAVPNSLESQIEADIKQYGFGRVLVNLHNAAKDAAYAQARSDMDVVLAKNEENNRIAELKSIGEKDPWVLSEKGMNELMAIRQSNPWINQSPEPMRNAYLFAKGIEVARSKSPAPQVQTPNPKEPTPPSAAAGSVVRTSPQKLDTPQKLQEYLKKLTPEQEQIFWKKQGLRF